MYITHLRKASRGIFGCALGPISTGAPPDPAILLLRAPLRLLCKEKVDREDQLGPSEGRQGRNVDIPRELAAVVARVTHLLRTLRWRRRRMGSFCQDT